MQSVEWFFFEKREYAEFDDGPALHRLALSRRQKKSPTNISLENLLGIFRIRA
jgi:hypothetical protein